MAKNFCIYCGAPLTSGVECACRAGAEAAPVYDDSTPAYAIDPIAYTTAKAEPVSESVPSKFCIYCGSPLTPGAECACRTAAPVPVCEESAPVCEEIPAYAMEPSAYVDVPAEPVVESVPSKFCIYCGSPLTPGVECSCRTVDTAPVYEESTPVYEEAEPVLEEPEVVPAETSYPKFCTKCGKPLTPGEICNCSAASVSAPTYEVPNPGAAYGGVKTTMRTESKPETTPVSTSPYLSRPTDLD